MKKKQRHTQQQKYLSGLIMCMMQEASDRKLYGYDSLSNNYYLHSNPKNVLIIKDVCYATDLLDHPFFIQIQNEIRIRLSVKSST